MDTTKKKNEKKPTNAQLQRRIDNAYVFVPKDKHSKSVYFDDKGLRLTYTMDYAIVETGFHRHVFSSFTNSGLSRPYLYVKQFVDIATANDHVIQDEKRNKSNSYAKLMEVLKEKSDPKEYHICWFVDCWLFNIFAPLYSIDETEAGTIIVWEEYVHNVAKQSFLLDEHKEDVTNLQYVNAVIEREKSFREGIDERVMLKGLSDDERVKQEMEALRQTDAEQYMEVHSDDKPEDK